MPFFGVEYASAVRVIFMWSDLLFASQIVGDLVGYIFVSTYYPEIMNYLNEIYNVVNLPNTAIVLFILVAEMYNFIHDLPNFWVILNRPENSDLQKASVAIVFLYIARVFIMNKT